MWGNAMGKEAPEHENRNWYSGQSLAKESSAVGRAVAEGGGRHCPAPMTRV